MKSRYAARRTFRGGDDDDSEIKPSTRPLSAAATRAVAAARARAASLQSALPSSQRIPQKEYKPSESPSLSPPASPNSESVSIQGSVDSPFSLAAAVSSIDSSSSVGSDIGNESVSIPSKPEIPLTCDAEIPPAAIDGEEAEVSSDTSIQSEKSETDCPLVSPSKTPESPSSEDSISHLLKKESEPDIGSTSPLTVGGLEIANLPAEVIASSKVESLSPPQSPEKFATLSDDFSPVPMPNLQDNNATQKTGTAGQCNIADESRDGEDASASVADASSGSKEESFKGAKMSEGDEEGRTKLANASENFLDGNRAKDSSDNNPRCEIVTVEKTTEMDDSGMDQDAATESSTVLCVDSSSETAETKKFPEASTEIAPTAEDATKREEADSTSIDSNADSEKGEELLDLTAHEDTATELSTVASTADDATKREEADATSIESKAESEQGEALLDPTALDSSDESDENTDFLNEDKSADERCGCISYESDDSAVADVGAGKAAEVLLSADPDERDTSMAYGRSGSDLDSPSEYLPDIYTPPRAKKKSLAKNDAEGTTTKKKSEREMPTSPATTEGTQQSEDDFTVASGKTISSATTLPRSNGFNSIDLARIEAIESQIPKGNCMLSILNMPKRKKGAKSNLPTGFKKKNEASKEQSDADIVKWSSNSVKDAIWRMRLLQLNLEGADIASIIKKAETRNVSQASKAVDKDRIRTGGSTRLSRSLQETAMELLQNNELAEALEIYDEILSSYQTALARHRHAEGGKPTGNDSDLEYHPCVATALFNIGIVHMLVASYERAQHNFRKCAQMRKELFGEENVEYLAALVKQGCCHYALGQFSDAEMAFEEALMSGVRETPSDRAQVAELLNNLGCIYHASGLRETALKSFQESLDMSTSALSESLYGGAGASSQLIMIRVATTRCNIGLLLLKQKEFDAAISEFEGALMHQLLLLNPCNSFVLATMDKLAFANVKGGDLNKALKMYNRMLEAQIEALGPHHIDCAQTLTKISLVHVEERNFERATKSIEKVIEAEEKNGNRNLSGRFKKLSSVGSQTKKKMSAAMAEARKSSRRLGERQKG